MGFYLSKVLIAAGWVVALASGGCTSTKQQAITPGDAQALQRAGKAVIIDVREWDEIKDGMVQGARWIPLSGIEAGNPAVTKSIDALDQGQEILTYCRSGNRSGKVAEILRGRGFKVRNLGGFSELKSAGLAVVVPEAPPQH